MANRLPPGGAPQSSIDEINNELMRMSINEIDGELMHIPNTLLPKIKQELGIPQDKDLATMTADEKVCSHIPWFAYLLIILTSNAYSHSTAKTIVTRPNPDQMSPNNHLTLLGLL